MNPRLVLRTVPEPNAPTSHRIIHVPVGGILCKLQLNSLKILGRKYTEIEVLLGLRAALDLNANAL